MEYVHHKGMVCSHRPEPFLTKHSLTAYAVGRNVASALDICTVYTSLVKS